MQFEPYTRTFSYCSGNCVAAYWEMAAHSAYDMFSKYKYLVVNLVFSHFCFWSGNFFLIAPFPDHCLLVPLNCCFMKHLKEIP